GDRQWCPRRPSPPRRPGRDHAPHTGEGVVRHPASSRLSGGGDRMRPVDFDYAAPEDIAGVVQALVDGGDDAKIISGGQSLMPALRMRMAAAALLVALRKVDGLRQIRQEGSELVSGAMVTHHTLATDPLV